MSIALHTLAIADIDRSRAYLGDWGRDRLAQQLPALIAAAQPTLRRYGQAGGSALLLQAIHLALHHGHPTLPAIDEGPIRGAAAWSRRPVAAIRRAAARAAATMLRIDGRTMGDVRIHQRSGGVYCERALPQGYRAESTGDGRVAISSPYGRAHSESPAGLGWSALSQADRTVIRRLNGLPMSLARARRAAAALARWDSATWAARQAA
jgi:hypothetical protein